MRMTSQVPSYHGYRFPPAIISHAVWLYRRFGLSFRDVEDLLAQRGIIVTYETVRQWCQRFGSVYARKLRRRRGRLGDTWHLDELFVTLQGRRQNLWRRYPILPEAAEEPGMCPAPVDHGQAAKLPSSPPHRDAVRGPRHGPVRQQPR